MSVAAQASAKLQNGKAVDASSVHWAQLQDLSTMASKPSTSVRVNAAACSSAATTSAKSYVTKALVGAVARQSSRRSAATADALSCIRLCHVVRKLRPVGLRVDVRRRVAILKYPTTVTRMTRLVPNARSLWRSGVCAGRKTFETNNAGFRTFVVERYVARSCDVDRTFAVSFATVVVSARTQMASRASNLVAKRRRSVATLMRTYVMHPSLARKKSHVKARSTSPASARHRSKR